MPSTALKRGLVPILSPVHQFSQRKNSHFRILPLRWTECLAMEIIVDDCAHVRLLLSSQRLFVFFVLDFPSWGSLSAQ